MLKKILERISIGFALTLVATMGIQFAIAQSGGSLVTARFAARFTTTEAAVLAQLLLVGLIGMAFSGASVVYEMERWSFLLQGIVYFAITAAVWVPVLAICWTPMPKSGILCSVTGWMITYAITWGIQYAVYRRRIRELNRRIRERNSGHECD